MMVTYHGTGAIKGRWNPEGTSGHVYDEAGIHLLRMAYNSWLCYPYPSSPPTPNGGPCYLNVEV